MSRSRKPYVSLESLLRAYLERNQPTEPLTQVEIAAALGCSRQLVQKTELRALKKMRQLFEYHGFTLKELET